MDWLDSCVIATKMTEGKCQHIGKVRATALVSTTKEFDMKSSSKKIQGNTSEKPTFLSSSTPRSHA
ncbi:hypothetical protein N7533_007188 [Penicillium manginii]|uniref:uncharacterized protein n=1 Tax=Penicillium manginii TaxID=203109 RepID=UPI002546D533|nr:uncharacterized protein N7533_007188 [Penicillium manginii]KAJ5750160.1 hypothetical protein N7533_007188 [Penicillium manginii]